VPKMPRPGRILLPKSSPEAKSHRSYEICGLDDRLLVQVVEPTDQLKKLKAGQTFIESAAFGNVSDPLLDREGVLHHVQAVNQNPPVGRSQYPRQHLDRGAFARTVGTEITDDLPALDLEGDIVHGQGFAVLLGQRKYLDVHIPA